MSANEFDAAIQKCLAMINDLPPVQRVPLLDMVAETCARHQRIQVSVQHAMNALDDWRLIQKYKVFDQEARAREAKADQDRRDAGEEEQ